MARGATIVVENNFTQGLITEASAMNFPENAVTEGENVVFSESGRVVRRDGLDFEPNALQISLDLIAPRGGVFNEFKWDAVGGRGNISFLVQQFGSLIRFFEEKDGAVSQGLKSFAVDLLSFKTSVSDSEVAENDCQFAFGKGFLFITHPFCDPISVKYNEDIDNIEVKRIAIEVRDFERLVDGYAADFRPSALIPEHHYNLFNQGWYYSAVVKGSSAPRVVLDAWHSQRSDYPSNSDVWWIYRGSTGLANFVDSWEGDDAVGSITPPSIAMGNTPAPNGHYIYSAWNINRTSMTGIGGLPTEYSFYSRPSCVVFFAGRVFYGGVSSNGYADKIYFSQIIESEDQFGKCYQANDPTSETIFDLLDTDGGVISLPLISKVTSMHIVGESLIVIGTNGIFAIRGTENGPFRATDYTVEFVSEIGTSSRTSIVNVDGSLLFWNYDAIYSLGRDQIGVSFQVTNISKPTIQKIIDSVSPTQKSKVKGAYNKRDRIVQWLCSSDSEDFFDTIIELNVVSKAFYIHTLPTGESPKLVGIISISGGRSQTVLENVIDNSSVIVKTISEENVQVETNIIIPSSELFKYPTVNSGNFSYSNTVEEHVDWGTFDFHSYFISGYRIRGELLRPFQSSPIAVSLENIEDGEVIIKGVWDYGARVTMPQWLYLRKTDMGPYFVRRVKLRGKGRAVQLRFDSEGQAPFSILGWSTFDTGGQQP